MCAEHRLEILEEGRLAAMQDTEFRCTRWQWEQTAGIRFWNKHFARLGKCSILRGEDYRNHIKAQPTEVQPIVPPVLVGSYAVLWLGSGFVGWGYNDYCFSVLSLYYGTISMIYAVLIAWDFQVLATYKRCYTFFNMVIMGLSRVGPILCCIPILMDRNLEEPSPNKRGLFLVILGYL